jgi:DNA polymerase III epsilon subunit family exonuclease
LQINELTFVFADVETTGLYVLSGDRICEIALLKYKGFKKIGEFHTLINPERIISPGAAVVNRITSEMVETSPKFNEIAVEMLNFIGDAILVLHNAPFDLGFFNTQLENSGYSALSNKVIDTLAIARKYYNFPSNSLGKIADHYGFSTEGAHRAMADVILTRKIFEKFMKDFSRDSYKEIDKIITEKNGFKVKNNPEAEILEADIKKMISEGKTIGIKYVDTYGQISYRRINPVKIINSGYSSHLVAFCHLRNEERTFRLDRILEVNIDGDEHEY